MNDSQMLEVEFRRTYDMIAETRASEVYLKLYVSFFKSGLVAALEPHRTVTLLALASFMNEDGRCYPTQDQIAERLGVHRTTANKWIADLLAFRWNDKPVVTRAKVKSSNGYSNCIYTVMPISQLAIFGGEIEPCSEPEQGYVPGDYNPTFQSEQPTCQSATLTRTNKQEPSKPETVGGNDKEKDNGHEEDRAVEEPLRNSKDVLLLFARLYRETYGVNYSVNFKRDAAMIKNKLVANYSMEQIRQIIEAVFREYDRKWATSDYPRPTVGQLCSWLPNRVLPLIEQGEQEQAKIEERIKKAEDEADDCDAILARLSKGGRA